MIGNPIPSLPWLLRDLAVKAFTAKCRGHEATINNDAHF
jgi:hypothetical protein